MKQVDYAHKGAGRMSVQQRVFDLYVGGFFDDEIAIMEGLSEAVVLRCLEDAFAALGYKQVPRGKGPQAGLALKALSAAMLLLRHLHRVTPETAEEVLQFSKATTAAVELVMKLTRAAGQAHKKSPSGSVVAEKGEVRRPSVSQMRVS